MGTNECGDWAEREIAYPRRFRDAGLFPSRSAFAGRTRLASASRVADKARRALLRRCTSKFLRLCVPPSCSPGVRRQLSQNHHRDGAEAAAGDLTDLDPVARSPVPPVLPTFSTCRGWNSIDTTDAYLRQKTERAIQSQGTHLLVIFTGFLSVSAAPESAQWQITLPFTRMGTRCSRRMEKVSESTGRCPVSGQFMPGFSLRSRNRRRKKGFPVAALPEPDRLEGPAGPSLVACPRGASLAP
jgi:hypothetical protein